MQRPPTGSYGRPPSQGLIPGTGLRSSYGGTVGGQGASIMNANVEVQARPAVREGMKGMTVGGMTVGQGRRVNDRSYYLGLLRAKIGELTAELERLRAQEGSINKNQAVTAQLSKSLSKVQEEIASMKTRLSDLNFTLEKAATNGFDHETAIAESQNFRHQNEQQKKENDKIFVKTKEEEKLCRTLEGQLQHQMAVLDQRLSSDPEKAELYKRLRDQNFGLTDTIASLRNEVTQLTERHESVLATIRKDKEKHNASEVQKEILRKRRVKEELMKECSVSLEEERQSLLNLVRITTSEIEAIGRQTEEASLELEKRQEQLKAIDQQLSEYQGENAKRYSELQQKDREMQDFLDGFGATEKELRTQIANDEARIVMLLEHISQNMKFKEELGTETNATARLQNMRDELVQKGKQADSSQSTYQRLLQELEARKVELEKVASLDEKLSVELASMNHRIEEQRADIVRFSDIEALRRDIDQNKRALQERKGYLQKRRDIVRQHIQALHAKHDSKKEELAQSDVHDGLFKQEQRMRVVLQSTFQLEDFVRSKERETAYLPLKAEALRLVEELNVLLRDQRRMEAQTSAGGMMSSGPMGGTMGLGPGAGTQTLRL